jgi:hypothetical protein
MIVDYCHTVDLAGLAILCDMGNVTGISLPHFPKGILLESLAIADIRVTGRFQVIVTYETLDRIHAYG